MNTALKLKLGFLFFIILLAVIGFPVALALAWAFEVSREGIRLSVGQPEQCTIGALTRRLLAKEGLYEKLMKKQGQEGEVVERQRARRIYEDFLHRNQDPALMEWMGTGMFKTSVFPVPAGSSVTDLVLSGGPETLEGKLLDADDATRIYEDIVRRLIDPALLRSLEGDLYEVRLPAGVAVEER